jgi:hypothetical protein
MSKVVKWLGIGVVVAVLGISATIGWRPFMGPKKRSLTDRRFEATRERTKTRYVPRRACRRLHRLSYS